jgi:sulfite oxidase
MRTLYKEVDGIDWGDGAVMNCRWRGPRLRDVLLRAEPNIKGKAHVAFASYSTKVQQDSWYGGSIELERGLSLDGEVILALEVRTHLNVYFRHGQTHAEGVR